MDAMGAAEERIGKAVIAAAMTVHSALGPGLLESAYEVCLAHELSRAAFSVRRQVSVPIRYGDLNVDNAYRIDLLVNDKVVVEVKVLDAIQSVHMSQLLSYLKLGGFKLGYLLNFNVAHMRDGLKRLVNGL